MDIKVQWERYAVERTTTLRNQIIEYYLPVAYEFIRNVYRRYSISRDDAIQVGYIGLIQAVERFNLCHKVKFTTFYQSRIRGAIIDEARRNLVLGRRYTESIKKSSKITNDFFHRNGRPMTDEEFFALTGNRPDRPIRLTRILEEHRG